MPRKQSSNRDLEELTDSEIYSTIRYLELDEETSPEREDNANFIFAISLLILVLGCARLFWF